MSTSSEAAERSLSLVIIVVPVRSATREFTILELDTRRESLAVPRFVSLRVTLSGSVGGGDVPLLLPGGVLSSESIGGKGPG